jgi:hypothetical protein
MHQPTAAGRTLEATVDDDGATRIVAHVVDPVAIAKVKSRTYSGFSIGGKVLARDGADPTVITRIRLSEISLVDRPANPEAVIDLWKADAAAPAPGNAAVKARAGELAKAAGRPAAWKDYVAKARATLLAEHAAALAQARWAQRDADADDDDPAPDDDDGPDADDTEADASGDLASPDEPDPSDDGDPNADGDDEDDDDAPSDDPADIAARLAQLAGADPAALQALHDALAALGAACDPDNCPDVERFARPYDLAKALPRLEALERRLAHQHALIERLAATPLPPRTAASPHARAIGKSDDADPASGAPDLSPADVQKALAALTPDERAFLLMKASLRQPIPLG